MQILISNKFLERANKINNCFNRLQNISSAVKLLLLILGSIILTSCEFFSSNAKKEPIHVEVFCPDLGFRTLILNITSNDFLEATEKALAKKKELGTNENYTVLVFKNKNHIQFNGTNVEDLAKCTIKDAPWSQVKNSYEVN